MDDDSQKCKCVWEWGWNKNCKIHGSAALHAASKLSARDDVVDSLNGANRHRRKSDGRAAELDDREDYDVDFDRGVVKEGSWWKGIDADYNVKHKFTKKSKKEMKPTSAARLAKAKAKENDPGFVRFDDGVDVINAATEDQRGGNASKGTPNNFEEIEAAKARMIESRKNVREIEKSIRDFRDFVREGVKEESRGAKNLGRLEKMRRDKVELANETGRDRRIRNRGGGEDGGGEDGRGERWGDASGLLTDGMTMKGDLDKIARYVSY